MSRGMIIAALRAAGFLAIAGAFAQGCKHPAVTRYWFKKHYFARVCKSCKTVLETGRDKSRIYPQSAKLGTWKEGDACSDG